MRATTAAVVTSLCVVLGCGREADDTRPRVANAELPPGVVARVANLDVHAASVGRIAAASGVTPAIARERAVADALFAAEAKARLGEGYEATIERAAFGRALLESLRADAVARGSVTDEELERLTRERWIDLDRPPAARVTHAVALRPKSGDASVVRRVAGEIAAAVRGIGEPKAFMDAAKAVPVLGVEVRAERLPAITVDGRGFSLEGSGVRDAGTFDPTFARAANSLTTPGEQSPVVETPFGFHVILLEAKVPEVRLSVEDRRRVLEREIVARRAGEARRALIDALSQKVRVEVARDFDARTAGLGAP